MICRRADGHPGRGRRPRLPRRVRLEGVPANGHGLRHRRSRRACARATACPSRSSRPRRRPRLGEHDENIDFDDDDRAHRAGARRATLAGCRAIRDGPCGCTLAPRRRRRGILLATRSSIRPGSCLGRTPKFEFGDRPRSTGELLLIDEALTPDSSRFWDAASYEPGRPQASFDKQFVRDWLETQPWDKTAPGPGAAGRRRRRDPRTLRRGLRADHRRQLRALPPGGRHRPMTQLPVRGQRHAEARASSIRRAGGRGQPRSPRDRGRQRRADRPSGRDDRRRGRRGGGARRRRAAGLGAPVEPADRGLRGRAARAASSAVSAGAGEG